MRREVFLFLILVLITKSDVYIEFHKCYVIYLDSAVLSLTAPKSGIENPRVETSGVFACGSHELRYPLLPVGIIAYVVKNTICM